LILGLGMALLLQDPVALRPEDPDSPVHPRKFGAPGGIGVTRGWYVWRAWNPETGLADVTSESSGEPFTVRVLPWMTTYRYLAYGASPDDLLPGERVNLFFNPDGAVKRAYLVHYQDEIGQMKGHNHAWQVEEVAPGGRGFTGRVMHGEDVFDPKLGTFELDGACRIWRDGKAVGEPGLVKGERLYLTWCYDGARRAVKLMADAASLHAIQADGEKRVADRIAREGMGAFVEAADRLLIFSTFWAQAAAIKPGQTLRVRSAGETVEVKVASRKNLGAYGSGPSEIALEDVSPAKAAQLRSWLSGKVVRVFIRE
jgi:hypothetical protein